MVFGSDLFNIIKFGNKIRTFQPILPLLVILTFSLIDLFKWTSSINFYYITSVEVDTIFYFNRYKKIPKRFYKKIFDRLIIINTANIAYATGSMMAIIGIKNLIDRKFYFQYS